MRIFENYFRIEPFLRNFCGKTKVSNNCIHYTFRQFSYKYILMINETKQMHWISSLKMCVNWSKFAITLLVRSRWNRPAPCRYVIPLDIPSASLIFIAAFKDSAVFASNCSNEPPLMYSVRACNCPSCTQTPMNLKAKMGNIQLRQSVKLVELWQSIIPQE